MLTTRSVTFPALATATTAATSSVTSGGAASPSRAKLAANEPLTEDREVSRSNCLSRFWSRARFPTMSDAVTSATRVAAHD